MNQVRGRSRALPPLTTSVICERLNLIGHITRNLFCSLMFGYFTTWYLCPFSEKIRVKDTAKLPSRLEVVDDLCRVIYFL
jgi:hypothetical protein